MGYIEEAFSTKGIEKSVITKGIEELVSNGKELVQNLGKTQIADVTLLSIIAEISTLIGYFVVASANASLTDSEIEELERKKEELNRRIANYKEALTLKSSNEKA